MNSFNIKTPFVNVVLKITDILLYFVPEQIMVYNPRFGYLHQLRKFRLSNVLRFYPLDFRSPSLQKTKRFLLSLNMIQNFIVPKRTG